MQATTAKTRPIIFSGEMVRAIQRGEKTQTRRIVKPHNSTVDGGSAAAWWPKLNFEQATARQTATIMQALHGAAAPRDVHLRVPHIDPEEGSFHRVRPCWDIGDRLWVKEAWKLNAYGGSSDYVAIKYEADGVVSRPIENVRNTIRNVHFKWRSPLFMPRWASRITLEIVDVRVERVQEISEADAQAEGCQRLELTSGIIAGVRVHPMTSSYRESFAKTWDAINGKREGCAWDLNPWVWVLEFKRVEGK